MEMQNNFIEFNCFCFVLCLGKNDWNHGCICGKIIVLLLIGIVSCVYTCQKFSVIVAAAGNRTKTRYVLEWYGGWHI